MRFAADWFLHVQWIPYAVLVLGLMGAGIMIARGQRYLPALLFVPLLFFMIVGSGRVPGDPVGWNDYYSAAFMPFAMILTAAATGLLYPRSEG